MSARGDPRAGAPSAGPPASDTLRLRWRSALPLLVLLALAVHTLLPQLASLEAAAGVLRTLRSWAVALAVAAQAASYWGNAFTVRACARLAGDDLPLGTSLRIALAAGTVGLLAGGPVGYAAATYHWTRRRGMSHTGAMLCGWLPGVLNMLALVALALLGTLALLRRHLLPHALIAGLALVAVAVVAIIAGVAWYGAREERLLALARRVRRARRRLRGRRGRARAAGAVGETGAADAQIVAAHRLLRDGGWRHPVLGALANAAFDVLTLACLFVAARHALDPGALLAGYGLPQLLGRASFLPGGVGIVEGGMVGAYALVGVPATAGVLVVLAYRGLSFWLPTLVGLPLALALQRGRSRTDPRPLGGSHAAR